MAHNQSSVDTAAEFKQLGTVFIECGAMTYRESFVQLKQYRVYAREYAGEEPAIILLHGFPDNLHLYDRLVPFLSPPRRVVTFDFLGWGASDKPSGYAYTATNQVLELDAVIRQLKLTQVILVSHDASGPPAIDWALVHSEQIAGLVLLNTYYCKMPTLRSPEAIWLFSTPVVRGVARLVSKKFGHFIYIMALPSSDLGVELNPGSTPANPAFPGSPAFREWLSECLL